jgi:hypothetical protein
MLGRAKSLSNRGSAITKLGGTLIGNAQRIGGLANTFSTSSSTFNPFPNTQAGFAAASASEGSF